MVKLNTTKTQRIAEVVADETTVNYEGATAYKLKAKESLVERVLGSFWSEDLFYQQGKDSAKSILADIIEVAKQDPKFVLQLAAYARNELYLRTAPQVLLVEAARIDACKKYVEEYTPKIVKRADELTEVVAYYASHYGKDPTNPRVTHKNFPNALKRGLRRAFRNFDEYQLNKYDSNKSTTSIGDVVRLVHPEFNGTPEYAKAIYAYLTKDEVSDVLPKISALKKLLAKDSIDDEALELIKKSSVTWETLISKFGSTKENWELVYPNMGYMALLRNLRNFNEKGVDLTPILEKIQDPEQVKRSKQLPFRFYSAYKQFSDTRIRRAIGKAFEASLSNVTLSGKTAVLVDVSGSMGITLSKNSSVSYKEVGAVLGAIASYKADDAVVVAFGSTAKEIPFRPDALISNIEDFANADRYVGHATNAWAAFELIKDRQFDRVILISDMQCYDTGGWGGDDPNSVQKQWTQYHKKYKNSFLFSLDISAYGTKQTSSRARNVVLLNGWSDKIIDFIALSENRDAMDQAIKKW